MKVPPSHCVLVVVVAVMGGGGGLSDLPTLVVRDVADDCCAGSYSLGVTMENDTGEPADSVAVTVVNDKTGEKAFSGFTDNAGQVDVTLPRGEYSVVSKSKEKKVKLQGDTDATLEVSTDELPKA